MKPKILILGTTEKTGGAAIVSWIIAQKMKSKGYSVKYLVGYKKTKETYVQEIDRNRFLRKIDKISNKNITALTRHFRSYIVADDLTFGTYEELFSHPWYKEADIVHLHNKHGNFIKFKALKRISKEKHFIWTLHDMWAITSHCAYTRHANDIGHDPLDCDLSSYPPIFWNNKEKLWKRKRKIYREARKFNIVTPSNWLMNKVKKTTLRNHYLSLIHNGINTQTFKNVDKREARDKFNLPMNKKIILHLSQGGGKNPRKGFDVVKKMAKLYEDQKDMIFLSVGGEKRKKKGNIHYLPFINDRKALNKIYNSSDLLLLPSTAENLGLVLLESMSTGLPAIAWKIGGIQEVIEHNKNGYLAKFKDLDSFRNGVKQFLQFSPDKIAKIQKNNRKKIENKFSAAQMVNKYEKLYKRTIS